MTGPLACFLFAHIFVADTFDQITHLGAGQRHSLEGFEFLNVETHISRVRSNDFGMVTVSTVTMRSSRMTKA